MPPIAERPAGMPGGEPSAPPPRRRRPAALWLVPLGATGILHDAGLEGRAGVRSTSAVPDPSWEADAFVVSGEFRADGSCSVLLDGHPVAAVDALRTEYEHDHATGDDARGAVGAPGAAATIAAPFKSGAPFDPRNFWVWGPVPTGEPLRPGRYRVVEEALEPGDTTAMEWRSSIPASRISRSARTWCGYRGYVRITRVDSPTVVGTFRMVAAPASAARRSSRGRHPGSRSALSGWKRASSWHGGGAVVGTRPITALTRRRSHGEDPPGRGRHRGRTRSRCPATRRSLGAGPPTTVPRAPAPAPVRNVPEIRSALPLQRNSSHASRRRERSHLPLTPLTPCESIRRRNAHPISRNGQRHSVRGRDRDRSSAAWG